MDVKKININQSEPTYNTIASDIVDGAVTTDKIADSAVTRNKLKNYDLPTFYNGLYYNAHKGVWIKYDGGTNNHSLVDVFGYAAIFLVSSVYCEMYARVWPGNNDMGIKTFTLLNEKYEVIASLSINDDIFADKIEIIEKSLY